MSSSKAVVAVKKNRTTYEWACLDRILRDREKHKKKSEVYDWGKRLPDGKIRKKRNSLRLTWAENQSFMKRNPQIPLGFGILDPVSEDFSRSVMNQLPFNELELRIREERFISTMLNLEACDESITLGAVNTPPQSSSIQKQTSIIHEGSEQSSALMKLETFMPPAGDLDVLPNSSSESSLGLYISPLYRAVLWSVSNNFAGLQDYSFIEVMSYLRKETDVDFYRIVASSSSYAAKAIMRNLFKAAIETGDAIILKSILESSTVNINPDEEVCFFGGERWTPIELASSLRHYDVIKVLLGYHVDVHKSFQISFPRGALSHLIKNSILSRAQDSMLAYQRPNIEVFRLLLRATRYVESGTVKLVVRANDVELFLEIFTRFARVQHREWTEAGIFQTAFQILETGFCKELVTLLVQVGADLNLRENTWERRHGEDRVAIIDVAASRGDLPLVQTLIANGARRTESTLSCAVSSGALDVVEFLLPICPIDGLDKNTGWTPLAAAIFLKDKTIIKLMEEHGAWKNISRENQFMSALSAASAAGNINVLQRLVNTGGQVTPEDLGKALVVLVKYGHKREAMLLIDAGADLDIQVKGMSALGQAIEQRDEDLVYQLLDAGASPYPKYTVESAAEWGKFDVIQRLILEGGDANCTDPVEDTALNIAVRKQRTDIVEFLLQAGANVNFKDVGDHSPLAVATKNGDMGMTQLLLDYGADPNDSRALVNAFSQGLTSILDVLITRYKRRYARPMKGFGSSLLRATVLQGDELGVEAFLRAKMDPEALCDERKIEKLSPFGLAIRHAQQRRINILQQFLNAGCDPNGVVVAKVLFSKVTRATALLLAAETDDVSVVEILVRHGGNVNAPAIGAIKRTPIQRAAELGLYRMSKFLIRINADVNGAPAHANGGTTLQFSACTGNVKLVKLLLDHGADVDGLTSKVNGFSALEGAAENGRLDNVQMLLNARKTQLHGWDQPQFDRAKQYAIETGHPEVVEMLEDYEAEYKRGRPVQGIIEV